MDWDGGVKRLRSFAAAVNDGGGDDGGSDVGREWRVVVAGQLGGGFKTTCLTCAGGGADLTSLREGRRHTAACLRRP